MSIIALAMLLTVGKGGLLPAIVIAFIVLVRTSRSTIWPAAAAVAGGVILVLWIGQFLPVGLNLARHLDGLASGLANVLVHPIGSGLGSTGFWGQRLSIGNDSTLGVVASQLGIAGAAAYVAWLATTAWRLLPETSGVDVWSLTRRTVGAAILAMLLVGSVSNSASGLLAGAFYALFAGWTMTIAVDRRAAGPTEA